MKVWVAAIVLLAAIVPSVARGQSVTTEADLTAGRSTEGVNAASVQLRLLGATKSDWRIYLESTWGLTTGAGSDAFGAAYPYDRRVRAMDTYLEKTFHPGGAIVGIRTGRYRTPFGISGASDYAYNGFVRPPLIRYGGNYALSNTFLEAGADVVAGMPALSVETSVGRPQDQGDERRHPGLDVVVRMQAYSHGLIVGASTIRTQPSDSRPFVHGQMIFHGVDARWMGGGIQLRGEWIIGRPFDGATTRGGYADVVIHHIGMGPVTAVGRVERLDYLAGPFSQYLRRLTVGARVRLTPALEAEVNVVRQPGGLADQRGTAVDVRFTYAFRFVGKQ